MRQNSQYERRRYTAYVASPTVRVVYREARGVTRVEARVTHVHIELAVCCLLADGTRDRDRREELGQHVGELLLFALLEREGVQVRLQAHDVQRVGT